uniref:Uncharacterized protein n=1 Tax=Chromera velia CCMP2878 TaxID=1169474 RepID=A0A0G4FS51_9ALVE|eukprot:Cvel_18323.t1-p1 / transcript=Cvel_18323.t1 / gene=Cvel_18323 / organism=Chromera_velia_CCMP2878 / gene_product=hypothetical protein / transcript_product=hypothetical protein / location=Cvel_scaffold1512:14099-20331(+) / protein_length=1145 / sequence_SO=supercontig / SO=protein_coding / is_pseudo=false
MSAFSQDSLLLSLLLWGFLVSVGVTGFREEVRYESNETAGLPPFAYAFRSPSGIDSDFLRDALPPFAIVSRPDREENKSDDAERHERLLQAVAARVFYDHHKTRVRPQECWDRDLEIICTHILGGRFKPGWHIPDPNVADPFAVCLPLSPSSKAEDRQEEIAVNGPMCGSHTGGPPCAFWPESLICARFLSALRWMAATEHVRSLMRGPESESTISDGDLPPPPPPPPPSVEKQKGKTGDSSVPPPLSSAGTSDPRGTHRRQLSLLRAMHDCTEDSRRSLCEDVVGGVYAAAGGVCCSTGGDGDGEPSVCADRDCESGEEGCWLDELEKADHQRCLFEKDEAPCLVPDLHDHWPACPFHRFASPAVIPHQHRLGGEGEMKEEKEGTRRNNEEEDALPRSLSHSLSSLPKPDPPLLPLRPPSSPSSRKGQKPNSSPATGSTDKEKNEYGQNDKEQGRGRTLQDDGQKGESTEMKCDQEKEKAVCEVLLRGSFFFSEPPSKESTRSICCPASCGDLCGQPGCHTAPPGPLECCLQPVLRRNRPCVLEAPADNLQGCVLSLPRDSRLCSAGARLLKGVEGGTSASKGGSRQQGSERRPKGKERGGETVLEGQKTKTKRTIEVEHRRLQAVAEAGRRMGLWRGEAVTGSRSKRESNKGSLEEEEEETSLLPSHQHSFLTCDEHGWSPTINGPEGLCACTQASPLPLPGPRLSSPFPQQFQVDTLKEASRRCASVGARLCSLEETLQSPPSGDTRSASAHTLALWTSTTCSDAENGSTNRVFSKEGEGKTHPSWVVVVAPGVPSAYSSSSDFSAVEERSACVPDRIDFSLEAPSSIVSLSPSLRSQRHKIKIIADGPPPSLPRSPGRNTTQQQGQVEKVVSPVQMVASFRCCADCWNVETLHHHHHHHVNLILPPEQNTSDEREGGRTIERSQKRSSRLSEKRCIELMQKQEGWTLMEEEEEAEGKGRLCAKRFDVHRGSEREGKNAQPSEFVAFENAQKACEKEGSRLCSLPEASLAFRSLPRLLLPPSVSVSVPFGERESKDKQTEKQHEEEEKEGGNIAMKKKGEVKKPNRPVFPSAPSPAFILERVWTKDPCVPIVMPKKGTGGQSVEHFVVKVSHAATASPSVNWEGEVREAKATHLCGEYKWLN